MGLLAAANVMGMADPLVMRWLIDVVLPKRQIELLVAVLVLLVTVYLGRCILTNAGNNVGARAADLTEVYLRRQLLRQLRRWPLLQHEQNAISERMTCLDSDAEQIAEMSTYMYSQVLRALFFLLLLIVMIVVTSPGLALIPLLSAPVFLAVRIRYRAKLEAVSGELRQKKERVSNGILEFLSGIGHLKTLQQERRHADRIAMLSIAVARQKRLRRQTVAAFSMASNGIIGIAIAISLSCGGWFVVTGALTLGQLIAFYGYLEKVFDPLWSAIECYSRLHQINPSILRVRQVLETKATGETTTNVTKDAQDSGSHSPDLLVHLRDVGMTRGFDKGIFADVNLEIQKPSLIVITGDSGGGKSTLAKIIAGLYQASEGFVHFYSRRDRSNGPRKTVGLLLQEPWLFGGTIEENLLYGNPSAGQSELKQVLLDVHLVDPQSVGAVERAISQLDSKIGPGGVQPSGGESQKLCLARLLLQSPEVMVLDEPTAALDLDSEKRIIETLRRVKENHAVVVISHRPALLAIADKVYAMRDGKLAEIRTGIAQPTRS